MRRFWARAEAVAAGADGWSVALDGRPLRTPARALLSLPTPALADAIASEWASVAGEVQPRALPLTGLANAAIDRAGPELAEQLAAYGQSDALCYRADAPPELVARQADCWDPPVRWASSRYDVAFRVVTGVMPSPQPPATVTRLREVTHALDPFRLAGLHPVVTVTGSLLLGLALLEGEMDAEAVWQAGALDELWQIERWGDDDLAKRVREARHGSVLAGARFLTLLGALPTPA